MISLVEIKAGEEIYCHYSEDWFTSRNIEEVSPCVRNPKSCLQYPNKLNDATYGIGRIPGSTYLTLLLQKRQYFLVRMYSFFD